MKRKVNGVARSIAAVIVLGVITAIGSVALGIMISRFVKFPVRPERSVVAVLNNKEDGGGTGFTVIDSFGRKVIVSNDHVCKAATNGVVKIKTDTGRVYLRNVLRTDPAHDLCLIEGVKSLPALDVGTESPRRFDKIKIVGHPFLTPTVYAEGEYSHDEIVSVIIKTVDFNQKCPETTYPVPLFIFGIGCVRDMETSMTTVPTYPGNSGSPVLNSSNDVIGVINIADTRMYRGGFIPLQYLQDLLKGN